MSSDAGRGFLPALLSFRGVLLFWLAYGVAHAALRLSTSRTLTIDDARSNELTQSFALGYQIRQPPLYEWILWSVQQLLGPGLESHLLVRYSLIALIGIATFGAVRAAVKDDRWAAAASLSLAFSYPVGWTFHQWATQTLLLCIACMLTVHAAIRFLERPGARAALLLGLALSVGFLAKFSFPLLVCGLVLAAASLEETRMRLADPRLLLSATVAALAMAPYGWWLFQVQGDVVADLASHLVDRDDPYVARAAYGLWRLAVSMLLFLLPWLAIVGLVAPQALLPAPAAAPPPSVAERLALRTMVFAILLAAIGILALGATNVASRYMHPLLVIAPVYLFARAARLAPGAAARRIASLAVLCALAVLALRLVAMMENPVTDRVARGQLIPYAGLADALAARGLDRGTLVTPSVRSAGNLRALLPELRVIGDDSLRVERPPPRGDGRSCAMLWIEGWEVFPRERAGVDPDAAERVEVPAQSVGMLASRGGVWFLARLDPQSPACR